MLVIFDCDGVLADSEPVANRVFTELIREYGWPISLDETMQRFVGRSLPSCIVEIEEHIGHSLPPEFAEKYYARTYKAFEDEVQPVEGVREVIESLKVPFCVASSSGHKKLRMTLRVTGLLPLFEGKIFSSEDVVHGKPAPDLFLYAARQMGHAPEQCIVIEDSLSGIKAGIAAEMKVLAYRGYADPSTVAELGVTLFEKMSGLPDLLKSQV